MVEIEPTCDQTISSREVKPDISELKERVTKLVSSVEDAIEENRKALDEHQAALYASNFLGKKHAARQMVPTLSQLKSYITEFDYRACYVSSDKII
jgi:hypothetical protein